MVPLLHACTYAFIRLLIFLIVLLFVYVGGMRLFSLLSESIFCTRIVEVKGLATRYSFDSLKPLQHLEIMFSTTDSKPEILEKVVSQF